MNNRRLFAGLLLAFEMRLKRSEPFIKKWFGFLHTFTGRAGFLILYVGPSIRSVAIAAAYDHCCFTVVVVAFLGLCGLCAA